MSTIKPLIGRETFREHFHQIARKSGIHGKKIFNQMEQFIRMAPDELFESGTFDITIKSGWETLAVKQLRKASGIEYKEIFLRTRIGELNSRTGEFLYNATHPAAPTMYISPKSIYVRYHEEEQYERFPSIRAHRKFPHVKEAIDQFIAHSIMAEL